jgi:hypothetical protein
MFCWLGFSFQTGSKARAFGSAKPAIAEIFLAERVAPGGAPPGILAVSKSLDSGLFVFDVLRLESLGLPSLAVIISGDLEHPGAGLRIAK